MLLRILQARLRQSSPSSAGRRVYVPRADMLTLTSNWPKNRKRNYGEHRKFLFSAKPFTGFRNSLIKSPKSNRWLRCAAPLTIRIIISRRTFTGKRYPFCNLPVIQSIGFSCDFWCSHTAAEATLSTVSRIKWLIHCVPNWMITRNQFDMCRKVRARYPLDIAMAQRHTTRAVCTAVDRRRSHVVLCSMQNTSSKSSMSSEHIGHSVAPQAIRRYIKLILLF